LTFEIFKNFCNNFRIFVSNVQKPENWRLNFLKVKLSQKLQTMTYDFDQLYQEFSPRIYKLCLSYSGDKLFADDLHQETWIAVWNSLPKFRGESKIGTWIYRIGINTCLVGLKKEKNKDQNSEAILSKLVYEETQDNSKEINRLYESISKLKESERIIITLVLEEKPYEEIAEITGITENNLRVKIHRIKKELQEIYTNYGRI